MLVNNVGFNIGSGNLLDKDLSSFKKTYQVNVLSYIQCAKGFLPSMLERQSGSIINISSTMSLGVKDFPEYSSSKGNINILTKSMALDYAKDHIRINAVAPGFIATPATQEFINEQKKPAQAKGVPMGTVGKPEDIAHEVGT